MNDRNDAPDGESLVRHFRGYSQGAQVSHPLVEAIHGRPHPNPDAEPIPYVVRGSDLERKLAAREAEGLAMPNLTLSAEDRGALRQRLAILTDISNTKGLEPTQAILAELGAPRPRGRGAVARYAAAAELERDLRRQLYGDQRARQSFPAGLKLAVVGLVATVASFPFNVPVGVAMLTITVVTALIGIIQMVNMPARSTLITDDDLDSGLGHAHPTRSTGQLAHNVRDLAQRYRAHDTQGSIREWSQQAILALGQATAERNALIDLPGPANDDTRREVAQLHCGLDEQIAGIEHEYTERAGALYQIHVDIARMNHPGLSATRSAAAPSTEKP